MSCRCSDMERCKCQVDKLGRNLERIQTCSVKSERMKALIEQLISYNNNAYISLDSPDLNQQARKAGEELAGVIGRAKEKTEDRIQKLIDTLKRLKEEDDDFHAQEDEDMQASLEEMQTK